MRSFGEELCEPRMRGHLHLTQERKSGVRINEPKRPLTNLLAVIHISILNKSTEIVPHSSLSLKYLNSSAN